MKKAWLLVIIAYIVAGIIAIGVGIWTRALPPIVVAGLADLAATVVIFLFSLILNNSSIYDPYWSVALVPIALFWLFQPGSNGFANPRHLLIFVLLCLWAIRLTVNWAIQWRGLTHEDWRYQDIRKQTGIFYWPASLLGIHVMPTILVFLGSMALWPTLSDRSTQLSWLDIVAALVTLLAILIEGTADLQMRRWRRSPERGDGTMLPGLWSLSRHPNYFGEVLFWWGLYLFVPLAYPAFWWIVVDPLAILLLFLGISIPLMERHLLAGHPPYAEYRKRVSAFFPWFPRAR